MECTKESCGKIPYATRDLAVAALGNMRDRFKRARNTSWRRLNIYQCDVCAGHPFHLGRNNKPNARRNSEIEAPALKKSATAKPPAPASVKKIPSYGQLMRRLRNIEARMHKELLHRAYVLGQVIERDRQRDYQEALACIYGSGPSPEGLGTEIGRKR